MNVGQAEGKAGKYIAFVICAGLGIESKLFWIALNVISHLRIEMVNVFHWSEEMERVKKLYCNDCGVACLARIIQKYAGPARKLSWLYQSNHVRTETRKLFRYTGSSPCAWLDRNRNRSSAGFI